MGTLSLESAPATNASAAACERERTWRLLIACARHAAGLTGATEVVSVATTVDDWAHVERRASAHGLLPWLARALSQGEGAPSDEHASSVARSADRAALMAAANACAGRTLAQVRRLEELIGALANVGVTALPYKGPVLSLQLYGDLALRQSVDLDLVVPFDAYDVARAALVRRGLPPRWGHTVRQEQTLFAWLGHAPFGQGDDFVELHWRFADRRFPFALDARDVLRRAQQARVAGRMLPLMAADDLLAVLSMHAARHLYERLEWVSGVTRLLVAAPVAPAALMARARALRAGRTLAVSVHVAAQLLDFPLDDAWRRALAVDPAASPLAERMVRELAAHELRDTPWPEGAALVRRYGELVDTRLDRARLFMHAALDPTAKDHDAVALPDALVPLHRVIRPLRLARRYWRG
ncbi:MAG: nucleotidyltransferase family protein [Gemmatimonadetes bacterium]|nr:nucleotidyltransferase family protein [Gemmatimonadota bacterium]